MINFKCHVYLWLRCPVQLMDRSGSALGRGIRLRPGWRPGWTCPLGDLVRGRESGALPDQLQAEAQGGGTEGEWAMQPASSPTSHFLSGP